jgi:hypothetical protein
MDTFLYLSLIPESLVVSMLSPAEFGTYLATGTKKRSREQAMYFALRSDFQSDYFDLAKARQACVPHPDGQPKHSIYVSTYRVLEHVLLEGVDSLWLATRDGRTLELEQQNLPSAFEGEYHLYQELCPVHPLIATRLDPVKFCGFITDPRVSVSLPKICFAELELAGLANDPHSTDVENLPYEHLEHLKDCLDELATRQKISKTINRIQPEHVPFRCVKSGFFIGDQTTVLYYPFPSAHDMEAHHHQWWRSAALS